MRRVLALVVLAAQACTSPTVVIPAETPDDFTALAEDVFAGFVTAFPDQEDCIGRVEIRGVWELQDRAVYEPAGRVIQVRMPATAAQLTISLVHELGHHLENACPDQASVREDFLTAAGLPIDTPWPDAIAYETDPSEMWAEAVVRYVTGRADSRRPLDVPEGAVEVVGRWSGNGLSHGTSAP